jgi:hypothetical protein
MPCIVAMILFLSVELNKRIQFLFAKNSQDLAATHADAKSAIVPPEPGYTNVD